MPRANGPLLILYTVRVIYELKEIRDLLEKPVEDEIEEAWQTAAAAAAALEVNP